MAKRIADTYLTDRNFDCDDATAEEPGTFAAANRDVLSTREIKKAKRRGVGNESESSPSTGAFKGFTGFGSGSSASFNFGFGSLTNAGSKPLSSTPSVTAVSMPSCGAVATTTSKAPGFSFGFTAVKPPTDLGTARDVTAVSTVSQSSCRFPAEYVEKLKCLNESLLRWIDQHVRSNPRCILTPVFRDYDRHLDDLNKTFSVTPDMLSGTSQTASTIGLTAVSTSTAVTNSANISTSVTSISGIGATVSSSSSLSTAFNSSAAYASPGFFTTSSAKSIVPATQQPPHFSFSASSSTTSSITTSSVTTSTLGGASFPASGFTFGTGGFKFGSGATQPSSMTAAEQPASSNTNAAEDDEEYVPPKPESVEIQEEDAFYTIRCKLFYMLNNEWKERGVGHLYLKPCPGDKTQLLVRSDTTLGNILLNISLTKSIPTSLQGKSNVSLSCVPNPPIDSKQKDVKPVCMLIRVKTADDAKQLLKQLEDNKK